MTTESMEVYSLEEGDLISIRGEVFRIVEIEDGESCDYRIILVDEEGYRRHVEADSSQKFSVIVLDNAEAVV